MPWETDSPPSASLQPTSIRSGGRCPRWLFARTDNRSVLGTMNDYAFMARDIHARGGAPETVEELMHFLAGTPILALEGARPVDLVRDAFRD